MNISISVEDRRTSAWLKAFRIILVVSLVVYSWKSGYDLGQEDMLNSIFGTASQIEEKQLFTSL